MKSFSECVDLISNNPNCILVKVKPICKMDMIMMGCFTGDEDMIRYTKDANDTITVFKDDGKYYSWERGTLAVETMHAKRRIIMDYVRSLK